MKELFLKIKETFLPSVGFGGDSEKGPNPYYRFWMVTVLICELIMLVFNIHLVFIYLVIAVLFLGGFLLRIAGLYPGEPEPFILDFSAVLIAFGFACLAGWLDQSNWRFLLILCSSTIIMPHIIYIYLKKQ